MGEMTTTATAKKVCWKCGARNPSHSIYGPNNSYERHACHECALVWRSSQERVDLLKAYWAGVKAQYTTPDLFENFHPKRL